MLVDSSFVELLLLQVSVDVESLSLTISWTLARINGYVTIVATNLARAMTVYFPREAIQAIPNLIQWIFKEISMLLNQFHAPLYSCIVVFRH